MKKMLLFALALVLVFTVSAGCGETAGATYHVDSMHCTFPVVAGWHAFYAGMPDDDLTLFEISRDQLNSLLGDASALIITNDDGDVIGIVNGYDVGRSLNLTEQTETYMQEFMDSFIPTRADSYGIEIADYGILRTDSNVYIRYEFAFENDEGQAGYAVTYFTTHDDLCYDISFYHGGERDEGMAEIYEDFIERMTWD